MDRAEWHERIVQSCKDAGTYEPYFENVIDTLAGILENRDLAQKQFKELGATPIIVHVNKGGYENQVKNPALVLMNDMNQQALAYWKELGLTSKSFQAMQKNGFKKKETTFEDVLEGIGI